MWVLNVLCGELSCVRCMLQNPFLASNLEYVVEPSHMCNFFECGRAFGVQR